MSTDSQIQAPRPLIAMRPERVWPLLIVAVAYYLAAEAAFAIGTLSDKIFAPFWPPNIVLFCALMLAPIERWWIFILAALPAHALAEWRVGMGAPQLVVAFITNCMVATLNAYAVRKLVKGPPWFGDLRKTSLYIVVTVLISPALCSLGGAFVPILGGGDLAHYWTYFGQWYAANALASVTLGPIALVVLGDDLKAWFTPPWHRHIEAALLGIALVVVCMVVFKATAGRGGNALLAVLIYAPLPIVVWAAERFGARGASGAIVVVTIVLIWRTLDGPSLFASDDPETNVFALQAFLIGLSVPILLLGASIDETRNAERATRASEERMAFAAASANIGLWNYSIAAGSLWASEHCRAMFFLPKDARITPDSFLDAVHPDDRGLMAHAFREALLSSRPFGIEFRIVAPGQEPRWMLASGCAHHDENHNPLQVSGIFIDISAQKSAEAEAELQRREVAHLTRVSTLGELSGAIAHELHQPLTAILSNAQAVQNMMRKNPTNLADLREALDDIVQEGNRAGEVVHRMRRLLRKDGGRLESIDLGELTRSTLRLLHGETVARKVRVKLQLAEKLPMLEGDPVQLQQVLLNLMMNAIEAMSGLASEARVLTVRSRQIDQNVELTISDRGPGIPPERLATLFQPFVSSKEQGLGLGLSICLTIVKSHGGELILENNKGGGAVAAVRLPAGRLQKMEAQNGANLRDPGEELRSLPR
jgi:signal transduction histidine kinase/integral membrane sensor domain MASE1